MDVGGGASVSHALSSCLSQGEQPQGGSCHEEGYTLFSRAFLQGRKPTTYHSDTGQRPVMPKSLLLFERSHVTQDGLKFNLQLNINFGS